MFFTVIYQAKLITIFLLFLAFFQSANALTPEERLPEAQEQRARNLFLQVRCVVCDGQVIESSDTEISRDMRMLIRQKIILGETDSQIKSYLIENFGSDIITSLEVNKVNLPLWLLPPFFFLILVIWQFSYQQKSKND